MVLPMALALAFSLTFPLYLRHLHFYFSNFFYQQYRLKVPGWKKEELLKDLQRVHETKDPQYMDPGYRLKLNVEA